MNTDQSVFIRVFLCPKDRSHPAYVTDQSHLDQNPVICGKTPFFLVDLP
jgi:hypothetical protein